MHCGSLADLPGTRVITAMPEGSKGEGMLLMEAMLGPDHLDIAKCCTGDNSSNLALEHYLGLLLNMYASQVLLGRAACCMRTRRLKTTMAAHTAYSRTASVQSTNWCSTR